MKKNILKHVLVNAVQYNGKADFKSVIGRIISENPEVKKDLKKIIPEVKKTIKEINSLSLKEQKVRLNKLGVKIEKKIKKEKLEFPPLPNAKTGKVVTAFPPEPSKYPHIGHAKAAFINYYYAKKYEGKFVIRFEDTNPRIPEKKYYEAMKEGLKWLGIKWNKIENISDYVGKMHKVTEKFLKEGHAYVCKCKQEKIKKYRREMKCCKCVENDVNENLKLWKDMLSGKLKEGEASVRLKISMQHKNALMRDPSIMRVINYPHPLIGRKYKVWPMYDLATALMDSWEGVTHRIRSKEFEMRTELQQYIQKLLGFKPPYIGEIARFNLKGVPSSGRKIREMIKNKELLGWDDPRLTSLIALKRRGFVPEAIKNFLISTGISKAESELTWSVLETFNRHIVDSQCNRYFAVVDPVQIEIEGLKKIKETEVRLHPDFPRRGKRKIPVNVKKIFISKEDFKKYKGKEIRLIGLSNVKLRKKSKTTGNKLVMEMPKIQWVSEKNMKIKILMPDGKITKGIAEPAIKKLKIDDIIQFMRLGFVRLDKKKPDFFFYFTHK